MAWLGQLDEAGRLGVRNAALERSEEKQQTLFDEDTRRKQEQLDDVADRIRDRFGSAAVRRALSLRRTTTGQGDQKAERP